MTRDYISATIDRLLQSVAIYRQQLDRDVVAYIKIKYLSQYQATIKNLQDVCWPVIRLRLTILLSSTIDRRSSTLDGNRLSIVKDRGR